MPAVARSVVCLHEDRPDHAVGLKLAVLSLLAHCPGTEIIVSLPSPPAGLRDWLARRPGVEILDDPPPAGLGWNVKPRLLLGCLQRGATEVLWMDTDIVVTRDFRPRFALVPPEALLMAEERAWVPDPPAFTRARAWGLAPGRALRRPVNGGVIRVTPVHTPLLERWQSLLGDPGYLAAQKSPNRPIAMLSDQEVLAALLESREFERTPVATLQRGAEIAQCYLAAGYTPAERLAGLCRPPPYFVHAMGEKPWTLDPAAPLRADGTPEPPGRFMAWAAALCRECSPYTAAAAAHRPGLEEPADWMRARMLSSRLVLLFSLGSQALRGFPLALAESALRWARWSVGLGRVRD